MERKAKQSRTHAPDANESILITQVVAHIVPGDSDQSMLGAAFAAASSFLEENSSMSPISLSWEYGGDTFEANYLPKRSTPQTEDDWDEPVMNGS